MGLSKQTQTNCKKTKMEPGHRRVPLHLNYWGGGEGMATAMGGREGRLVGGGGGWGVCTQLLHSSE